MRPTEHIAMVLHGKFWRQVGLNEAEQWVPIARAARSETIDECAAELVRLYGDSDLVDKVRALKTST